MEDEEDPEEDNEEVGDTDEPLAVDNNGECNCNGLVARGEEETWLCLRPCSFTCGTVTSSVVLLLFLDEPFLLLVSEGVEDELEQLKLRLNEVGESNAANIVGKLDFQEMHKRRRCRRLRQ